MKVLVVGLNYAPENIGIAVYTTGMAEALSEGGHHVRVVAGQPYYPAWEIMDGHNAWSWSRRDENGVRVIRVPHYIPADPTGLKRLLHHATFAASALVPALWQGLTFRPDVVIAVAPSLIGAPAARLAGWVAGARNWLHVQDFEVEAAFATGLMKAEGWAARIARAFEAAVIKSFDLVSAISPEMCRRLVLKGVRHERVTEFRNWADIDAIRPMVVASRYRQRWGISSQHVALYSGNIANKQGIELVIEAARRLRDREDLTFVICGQGPNRSRLQAMAAGLDNVQFHDLQPREQLNDLMGLATIHLLPQLAGAADLVLPSKLTNMLASGRPVVATAAPGTGLAREVEGCGAIVEPGNADAFAHAIASLVDDPQAWSAAATTSRNRAEERWSKDMVLAKFGAAVEMHNPNAPELARLHESK